MYRREIPRDLFNEAKLLKCLGQLSLILHDAVGIRWPLRLEHDDSEHPGFVIEQDASSGDIYCNNLSLYLGDKGEIELTTPLNSREPYPLMYQAWWDEGQGNVFTDDGKLSEEFKEWLDHTTRT